MTRVVILPSKRTDETVSVEFPFGDQLMFGEAISGQLVTVTVFAGVDASPSAILLGSPTISGNIVRQDIQGGLKGVIYQLVCVVTTSLSHLLAKGARQAIASDPGAFTGL